MSSAPGDVEMAAVEQLAAAAGVRILAVETAGGHHDVARLFSEVWAAPVDAGPVRAGTMRAASHVGAYMVGVHVADGPDADAMVGASFAFHGADGHLHSHVTGIAGPWQGRGLGVVVKLHQRAWCLQRGVGRVTWTFDPLVRRNAWFNLRRLGARMTSYLPSFYGPMSDGINVGDDTDRAWVEWDLGSAGVVAAVDRALAPRVDTDVAATPGHAGDAGDARVWPAVVTDADGGPATLSVPSQARLVAVALPPDVEQLRRTDPRMALRWRHVVRDAMGPRLQAGWHVDDLAADGSYLMEAP